MSPILEYAASSRAKCNGPKPCAGSNIERGTLRYGQVSMAHYGETVKWRHWGCVTPDILRQLAAHNVDRIPGFQELKVADQAKVRQALARRHVDPADVPDTAKPPPSQATPSTSRPEQVQVAKVSQKRNANVLEPQSSQPSAAASSGPSSSQINGDGEEANTDEPSVEETRDELYCVLKSQVVGTQYYSGLVGPGEEVTLLREPTNPYDRNAIQVDNIAGDKVGHIPRQVAAKLSPLLDQKKISVEGRIHEGNLHGKTYSITMSLRLFGPVDQRSELERLLAWATPQQRGFPPPRADGTRPIPGMSREEARTYNVSGPTASQIARAKKNNPEEARKLLAQKEAMAEALKKAEELRSILANLEKVDDDNRRGSLLDTLCPASDVLALPEHANPPGIATGDLYVDLLKHQKQGLQWCIAREYPKLPASEGDSPEQFWQYQKNGSKPYYFNLATKTPQEQPPVIGRGGLCADSMGLGKTLTMLALVLATKADKPTNHTNSTLIVVPLSILSNWESQIKEHCQPGAIRFHTYYDTGRSKSPESLRKYDIVITTYQVVTQEHGLRTGQAHSAKRQKAGGGLFDVQWKRIILDEGHTIRNPKTKMAAAVCALSAERRWVLSGTPIINSPRDLGSMLTFLQVCRPLDKEDYFKRLLLRPLKDGMPEGYQLLRAVMSQICIRRTKEMQDSNGNPLVPLPGVEMISIPVKLDAAARELYDAVEELSQQKFQSSMEGNGGTVVTASVLSLLTRLRQIVLHPALIPHNYLDELRKSMEQEEDDESDKEAGPRIPLTPELKKKLQATLTRIIEDSEECPICLNTLSDPRITTCAHAFCLACITEVLTSDTRCPMDRRKITVSDLVEPASPDELSQPEASRDEDSEITRAGSSAKIDQLVRLLQLTPLEEKSLVFSQFTSFLDKIGQALDEAGISYCRFDGSMNAKQRQETLQRFCVPIQPNQASTYPDGAIAISSDEDDGDFKIVNKGKGKITFSSGKENPKVMLISLKAGALGLNLTVANNVYLMDPWWQEGIESQAIDRCNRIGQKRKVHVYQLIAENTVESKVIDIQERKKKLIQQAFSGMKSKETPRQKREARMQDLIELFGIRQQEATQRQTTLDGHLH